MKTDEMKKLLREFEQAARVFENVECFSARKLQTLLGYGKWEDFEKVILKAKEACENAGEDIDDRFPDVGKMVNIGSENRKGC